MKASYIDNFDEWKAEFEFSVPIQVRFSETDMFGHVNNTVPVTYFEFARIEYMKTIGLMQNWLERGHSFFPVVADIQVDYVRQVYFDEVLQVHVKVASIGNSSIDVHYWIANEEGETCYTGRGTVVQISKETGKGHPWTKEEKQLFRANGIISSKS